MGIGYTTILYDAASLRRGIGDVGACRYDGIEIALEKIERRGPAQVRTWLDEHDLDCYLVMGGWLESDADAASIADGASVAADLDADFLGVLPPQRGRVDDETLERWLAEICDAAAEAGVAPLLHHHGATHVEQPDEIREWLDRTPDDLRLLFDTAHYYPYGEHYPDGDVTDGLERFADDVAYVHLKDVDPPSDFEEHREALSNADFHLDNVITYFRAFTDLGAGVLDFGAVDAALDDVGYGGHVTIEIENRTDLPLVHAKGNYDYYVDLAGRE